MRTSTNTVLAAATFATLALARTDLEGCTRTDVSSPAGASYAWYVPGTGELCEMLDCGGGRAPPKTTVPGCAAYSGTETYSPSYLAGYQASATAAPSTTAEAQTTSDAEPSSSSSVDWSALETDTAVSSWDLFTTLGSATGPITDSPTASEAEATSSAAAITDASHSAVVITDASSSTATITDASSVSSILSSAASTLVAQTTAAGNAPNNGTVTSGRPGTNGTVSNGTASPSAPVSDSGVARSAKAWVGSAGLMMGLAGLVALL
jgi:hypothetical protein